MKVTIEQIKNGYLVEYTPKYSIKNYSFVDKPDPVKTHAIDLKAVGYALKDLFEPEDK